MESEVQSSSSRVSRTLPKRTRSLSGSSSEWIVPSGEAGKFARMKYTEDGFEARIHLDYFSPRYDPDEVFVDLCGYDLQINARREHPETPFRALRKLHRHYQGIAPTASSESRRNSIQIHRAKRNPASR
ncbi:hypothetical protein QR680_006611 [Steinernema hermaphroditum]|uniref:SHSP domain-containing protein n=1 Tax=Steinernema hermaphroditum TaxID=289476 RepID=A0AA39LXE1_9BILA|nr:hypothetical protein QR680_006611 [Steinernema hermaphroditum]